VCNIVGVEATNEDVIEAIRRIIPDARLDAAGPDIGIAADVDEDALAALLPGLTRTSLADGIARTIEHYRRQARHNT